MSDVAAFLRAIQADPTDRTAKLVYADWLDERDEAAKAAYVRAAAEGRRAPTAVVPGLWSEVFHGVTPLWDEVTMLALGRLQGLLEAFRLCSDRSADITYDFHAHLLPRTGELQEMAERYYGPYCQPVRLEPLADWQADLRVVLREHLMRELGHIRSTNSELAIQVDWGRECVLEEVFQTITIVATPSAYHRAHITEKQWYAINWADVVLEAADRVLFLHFSFSD